VHQVLRALFQRNPGVFVSHTGDVSGARGSVAGGAFGPPQIGFDEINLLEEKGRGYFGIVYRAMVRGCEVAVKVPHREVSNPAQFMREVNVLSKLFHPNVCLFMGACLSKKVMIVTELMKGDVETLLLNKDNKFKLSELISMALDAAKGMAWLHGNNPPVYHRDLKIANLLYDDSMKIKVTSTIVHHRFCSFRSLFRFAILVLRTSSHQREEICSICSQREHPFTWPQRYCLFQHLNGTFPFGFHSHPIYFFCV
jgi:hypothetical protein